MEVSVVQGLQEFRFLLFLLFILYGTVQCRDSRQSSYEMRSTIWNVGRYYITGVLQ